MDTKTKELCRNYIVARRSNPAWRLLAARRAPLVLSCLKQLFENRQDGIDYEDAVQLLAHLRKQITHVQKEPAGAGVSA